MKFTMSFVFLEKLTIAFLVFLGVTTISLIMYGGIFGLLYIATSILFAFYAVLYVGIKIAIRVCPNQRWLVFTFLCLLLMPVLWALVDLNSLIDTLMSGVSIRWI